MQAAPHNAIANRMDTLIEKWSTFSIVPEARVCRWKVDEDELAIVKGLPAYESSEGAVTPDVFFIFRSPVQDEKSYGRQLIEELRGWFKNEGALLQEEGLSIKLPLIPRNASWEAPEVLEFMHRFATSLSESVELEAEGLIVMCLFPPAGSTPPLANWVQKAIEAGISPLLRLMVIDLDEHPCFDPIATQFPDIVHTLIADLDMRKAIHELAETHGSTEPDALFRKHYTALSAAAGKKDWSEAQFHGQEALKIAGSQQWNPMQVTVYMALAGAAMSCERKSDALTNYDEAFAVTEKMVATSELAAEKLAVQVLFGKASMFIADQDYKTAFQVYQQAVPFAEIVEKEAQTEEEGGGYYLMESLRMSGFCQLKIKEEDEAWTYLKQAWETGLRMNPNLQKNTTLPYIGRELLNLIDPLGYEQEEEAIEKKMIELLGEDWEQKL